MSYKIDPKWLVEEYVDKERTMFELATEVGCSIATIGRRLASLGIATRTIHGYLRGMSFAERFWSHVDRGGPAECWSWRDPAHSQGYGQIMFLGVLENAPRIILGVERREWPLPEGVHACHTCDNPSCVNPAHIYAGTPATNAQDRSNLEVQDVQNIRELSHEGLSAREIGARYGIAPRTVRDIVNRVTWREV